jgi:hypothetical protein
LPNRVEQSGLVPTVGDQRVEEIGEIDELRAKLGADGNGRGVDGSDMRRFALGPG